MHVNYLLAKDVTLVNQLQLCLGLLLSHCQDPVTTSSCMVNHPYMNTRDKADKRKVLPEGRLRL